MSDAGTESGNYEPLFTLYEYARAEQHFIHDAVEALARARDGFFGQIKQEPVSSVQTTQVTTDGGDVVEMEAVPVQFPITIEPSEVISGSLDTFLASLDTAADAFLSALMPPVFDYLARISEATGNVVDAKDRPFFDSFYEMVEKMELDFDDEGNHGAALVVHPDTARVIEDAMKNITPEQQQKLDELWKRKREESDARRRRRRLS
jgi:hypothetical protein